MRIGILALQGDFEAHGRLFSGLGHEVSFVRKPAELDPVEAIVLPGGESTTMLNFLEEEGFLERLRDECSRKPVFATCAGLVLLAREVESPSQRSLGLLDVAVERNAWGRQIASFVSPVDSPGLAPSGEAPLEAVFIRAPRIRQMGAGVLAIATLRDEPVLVRQGGILAATFHPELTQDDRIARYFVEIVARPGPTGR